MDGTYPRSGPLTLPDGTPVWWRPVEASDRAEFQSRYQELSVESRYRRFHQHLERLPESLWDRLLDTVDLDQHVALILFTGAEPIAVCHIIRSADEPWRADVAVTVADAWQGRGAGGLLLHEALALADDIAEIDTQVLSDNVPARRMLERLGPTRIENHGSTSRVVVDLAARPAA